MSCTQITPGPQQGVALFVVDDCWKPVYGDEAGYFDSCALVDDLDVQTAETRAEFLKSCPNGDIRAYAPPRTVTKYTGVTAKFPWLPIEFLANAGAVTPFLFNGEVVGYSDCDNAVNLIMVVWQENMGNDSCSGSPDEGPPSVATLYALREVRFGEDGQKGTSDFNYTLVGNAIKANVGAGPMPLFWDSGDPDVPAYPADCIQACAKGFTSLVAAPPDECGFIDTVAPVDPCVTAS